MCLPPAGPSKRREGMIHHGAWMLRYMHMTTPAPFPLATLEGVLERITYANEETGYTVARVTTGRDTDLLTVVGNLLGTQPGESLSRPRSKACAATWAPA